MAEKIYTIPINEAFDKTLESETPDCPLCLLRRMLEKNEIERITGAAMMEPDVRIETNKKGFCRRHFDMMTGGGGYALSWKNRKGISICCQSETGCWQKWFAGRRGCSP